MAHILHLLNAVSDYMFLFQVFSELPHKSPVRFITFGRLKTRLYKTYPVSIQNS